MCSGSQNLKPNNNIVFEHGVMLSGLGCFTISEVLLLFTKHSNNIGLRENSHVFVPSSFSHLKSDVLFFYWPVFQTMLYTLLISAHAHLLHDTDHASKPHVYFFKASLGFIVNIHKIIRHLLSNGIYSGTCGYYDWLHFYWDNTWTFRNQLEMSQLLCWSRPSSFALLGPQPEGCSTARGMM